MNKTKKNSSGVGRPPKANAGDLVVYDNAKWRVIERSSKYYRINRFGTRTSPSNQTWVRSDYFEVV